MILLSSQILFHRTLYEYNNNVHAAKKYKLCLYADPTGQSLL
jgi:hypothetical protein